jgi:hypothetical protein
MKSTNIIRKLAVTGFLLAGLLCLAGCATIVSGTNQSIDVNSEPEGADFKVEQLTVSGPILLQEGRTPSTIKLHRKDLFFLVTLMKQGYETAEVPIEINPTGNAMVMGNLLIGGVIGILVDSASGAAITLEPGEVKVSLVQSNH